MEQISKEVKKKKANKNQLEFLTSDFYSYIPHNIGFQQAPVIDSNKKIKEKLEMLASLEQIQIATKLLDNANSLDENYQKLKCAISPLEKDCDAFRHIAKSVKHTHGATHDNYKLEVEEIYQLDKDQNAYDCGKHHLLWHGSRLTNFVGILSSGLRIAPPEAPVTGYMFGKGIYFADMISKSANYCCSSYDNPKGCILLCDVSLGECNEKFEADYYANELPEGKSSTKGCGKFVPEELVEIDGC